MYIYICIYIYMYIYNGMSTDNNCDIWVCPQKKVTQVIPSLIEIYMLTKLWGSNSLGASSDNWLHIQYQCHTNPFKNIASYKGTSFHSTSISFIYIYIYISYIFPGKFQWTTNCLSIPNDCNNKFLYSWFITNVFCYKICTCICLHYLDLYTYLYLLHIFQLIYHLMHMIPQAILIDLYRGILLISPSLRLFAIISDWPICLHNFATRSCDSCWFCGLNS